MTAEDRTVAIVTNDAHEAWRRCYSAGVQNTRDCRAGLSSVAPLGCTRVSQHGIFSDDA